jgi:hypothetical protein
MNKAFAIIGFLFLASPIFAKPVVASAEDFNLGLAVVPNPDPQSSGHQVNLSWTLSVGVGIVSQNVYRANCTGTVTAGTCSTDSTATFTKLSAGTAIGPTLTTFSDTTVAAGASYIYYVTAVCPTAGACVGESSPSSHVAGSIPGNPPPPPTGLQILTISKVINPNGSETFTAKWSDTNTSAEQTYSFSNGTQIINQGLTSSLTGTFAEEVTVPNGTAIVFLVSDAMGAQAEQAAN